MPFIRQQVGGTTAQIKKYEGYDKQLVVNTENHRLHVMDGETKGGYGVVMQYDLPLGTDDIADKSITSAKLADGAITADKIPNKVITTAKLADGAVTTPKLADDAVTSEKIKDGEVKTNDLADGSVTFPKLNSALVATPAQAKAGIATDKLVTPAGLKAVIDDIGEISYTLPTATESRLGGIKVGDGLSVSSDGILEVSGVTSAMITNGTITANDLAAGVITVPKLNSAVYASEAEAKAGTNTTKLITPALLAAALSGLVSANSTTTGNVSRLYRFVMGDVQLYIGYILYNEDSTSGTPSKHGNTITWPVAFKDNTYLVYGHGCGVYSSGWSSAGRVSSSGHSGDPDLTIAGSGLNGKTSIQQKSATGLYACSWNEYDEEDGSDGGGSIHVAEFIDTFIVAVGKFNAS